MVKLFSQAGCFVAIIMLGALLRKVGFFKREDMGLLAKISLRITLPAAIVSSFSGKTLAPSLLLLAVVGLVMNMLLMAVGWVSNLRRSRKEQAFGIVNLAGCNVGAFTVPFVQSILGAEAVVVASLFDLGNAIIGLGTSYGVAATVQDGKGFSFGRVGKTIVTSPTILAYVIMTVLTLLGVQLPGAIVEFADLVGRSNTFIAMLMIGVGFELTLDKSRLGRLLEMILLRYGVGAILAVAFWNLLPFAKTVRLVMVILALSPIITAAPAYTKELQNDVGLSSALNSICIVLSMLLYVAVLSFMM